MTINQNVATSFSSADSRALKVLFITSQYPTPEKPAYAPFVEREVRALRHAGVDVDVLAYDGGWSPGKYWRAVREMYRRMGNQQYDLIHAYFGQCGVVARAQTRLPIVITYGGSDVEGSPDYRGLNRYRNYVLTGVSRFLARSAAQVIVVSKNLGRKLPRKDYHVITIALDLDLFQQMDKHEARAKLGLPQDGYLALFAANPENARKRHSLALEVCRVASQTAKVDLVTATKRPPLEIPIFMSACDALLLTSTNEGSTNVVREALACNLPVVSTDVGDSRERLEHLDSCVVCVNDDAYTMAQALLRVVQRERPTTLRNEVIDQDYRMMGHQVVAVYQQALKHN
jgi:glycosyltransferase involved in cell wall biosynthesis